MLFTVRFVGLPVLAARLLVLALALVLTASLLACESGSRFDVLPRDAAEADVLPDRFELPDVPPLGRACMRDQDCDDAVSCTTDRCGEGNRCVNTPDPEPCNDGLYCNGIEQCDARRGCIRGEPITCNDGQVCTADRCVEETRSCEHRPLDRDGDGDPDDHCSDPNCVDGGVPGGADGGPSCWVGRDCNDRDPRINTIVPEICGDGVDNNCNGTMDEQEPGGCRTAPYDRCDEPLDVSTGGVFRLPLESARGDYSLACAGTAAHDMVARFELTEPRDVTIEGAATGGPVSVSLQSTCGSTTSTDGGTPSLECDLGFPGLIRRHSLPAGEYFVIVASNAASPVDLTVRFSTATAPAANDTCASAIEVPADGGTFRSDLAGVADDIATRCGGLARDVLYRFTLTEPRDVSLQLAGDRRSDYLHLSLTRDCVRSPDVVRCDSGDSVQFNARSLPAGTYYVVIESFEPVNFTLQVLFGPPTLPPPGDQCTGPLVLTEGMPVRVNVGDLEADYRLACYPTGRDAVLRFELAQRRDVRVRAVGTSFEFLAVGLDRACPPATTGVACATGIGPSANALGLDPGSWYAVVKSPRAGAFDVTLETFAPISATTVGGNDVCTGAREITGARALFNGNTTTLTNDYRSPCGGTAPGNDAVYRFTLATRQRVSIDTTSSFFHVAWVSTADACPGSNPASGGNPTCTLGNRTNMDLLLDAGSYYLFIDGYNAADNGTYSVLFQQRAP